jgi:catechol 2,3-dioxygenase-like lactoylglutathione lyase family enzyme
MDQRADFITVATPDLDAARLFYVDGLGWVPLVDVPGEIVFFQVNHGLMLGLFESEHFDADLGDGGAAAADQLRPAGLTLSHNVAGREQVATVLEAAVAAGATLLTSARETGFGGFHGHFADPNGLIWEICHNPAWSVGANGEVALG